jgi:hypothetical protein
MVASWDSHSLFIGRDCKPGSLAVNVSKLFDQLAFTMKTKMHITLQKLVTIVACHLSQLDRAIYTSWMWNGKLEETKTYYILLYNKADEVCCV